MIAIHVSVADATRPPQEASPSDRQERTLALEELHAMGILHREEFAAEMKSLTDPHPTFDPMSPELPAQRERRRRHPHVLIRRFS